MAKLTRRGFAAGALAAVATQSLAQQRKKEITSASVPEDPDAPGVQQGTLPEDQPFGPPIEFKRRDIARKLQPFAMMDVRLLPGVFHDAQQANRSFMHEQSPDRLLHVFRLNAGLPSTAEPLGGWEKPDCELRGHFVGHYLSACAQLYASTGDKESKVRGDYLVAELAKCQAKLPDGYLSAFPITYFDRLNARTKVWAPFYTVHKIMAGMLDMHQHCGNSQALAVLAGMSDWADKLTAPLPEEHMQMLLDTEYGGMNEVLYNLAAVTGEDRYARVGDRFTKKRFFNPLALRRDELRGLHANTHIPQVMGAARRYEISGDTRFRDVAEYFWQAVVSSRSYVTGGTSNNEGWLVGPNKLAAELALGYDTNECCCAYNMLKLTRKLYSWTGDPRLFDYYERVLLNHRLGTINARGETQYYLGVVPGSWRTFSTMYDSFWCCTGSGTEEFSKLNDSIYFHDENGIYVNLFIASEVSWAQKSFRLRQQTSFPEEARSRFVIDADGRTSVAVHIRVPSWVAGSVGLRINDKPSEVAATPGSYLSISRIWKNGDRIEIDLPMTLRYEAMPDDGSLKALLYGPIVLAGGLGSAGLEEAMQIGPMGANLKKHPPASSPEFRAADKELTAWIHAGDKPLTFETSGQRTNVRLEPFYRLSGQRYSLYWRVS